MNVVIEPSDFWNNIIDISKVEKRYNAKYVCESCVKNSSGWRDDPSLIFYTENAHPEGSNYFAISIKYDSLGLFSDIVISDGISAVSEPFTGIIAENGDVIYSRYRHDYRTSPDGSVTIDGGRNYLRSHGTGKGLVNIKVINDKLVVEKFNEE